MFLALFFLPLFSQINTNIFHAHRALPVMTPRLLDRAWCSRASRVQENPATTIWRSSELAWLRRRYGEVRSNFRCPKLRCEFGFGVEARVKWLEPTLPAFLPAKKEFQVCCSENYQNTNKKYYRVSLSGKGLGPISSTFYCTGVLVIGPKWPVAKKSGYEATLHIIRGPITRPWNIWYNSTQNSKPNSS